MTYAAELAFAVDTVRRAAKPALALFERSDLPVFDKPGLDGSIVTRSKGSRQVIDLDVNDLIAPWTQ